MRPVQILPEPEGNLYVAGRTKLYLRPADLIHSLSKTAVSKHESDRLFGGGPHRFQKIEVVLRSPDRIVAFYGSVQNLRDWAIGAGCLEMLDAGIYRITHRRPPFLGRHWDRPLIMGIVNATPDSFSDGINRRNAAVAVSHAHALIEAGADILDIGGESTRPGSVGISEAEELDRVIPVIEQVAGFGVPVSIDTSKAAVMIAALTAGASVINDTTALTGDPGSLGVASRAGVPVILMHMQGRPRTMQNQPYYDCAPLDVIDYLEARATACQDNGISASNLIVDPGIGFGKTDHHNLLILARIGLLHGIGVPVMIGVSRKSLIGRIAGSEDPVRRLGGSLALALGAVEQGVQFLRVHDVAETRQALMLRQAVIEAAPA